MKNPLEFEVIYSHGHSHGYGSSHRGVNVRLKIGYVKIPLLIINHHVHHYQWIGLREKITGNTHISYEDLWFPVDCP